MGIIISLVSLALAIVAIIGLVIINNELEKSKEQGKKFEARIFKENSYNKCVGIFVTAITDKPEKSLLERIQELEDDRSSRVDKLFEYLKVEFKHTPSKDFIGKKVKIKKN